jgi:hypothetical protein
MDGIENEGQTGLDAPELVPERAPQRLGIIWGLGSIQPKRVAETRRHPSLIPLSSLQ